MSIIDIAIAKGCHDKKEGDMRTSTGRRRDQYWLLPPPCAGVRYEAIVQIVVVARLERLSPTEEKKSPRGGIVGLV